MVVVTTRVRGYLLEMATRAKRELILIIAESKKEKYKKSYKRFQLALKAAADEGLVDLQVSESENNITIMIMMILLSSSPYSTPPEIDPKPAGDREREPD